MDYLINELLINEAVEQLTALSYNRKINDEKFSKEFHKIVQLIPTHISLNHYLSNKEIRRRVEKYCKKNHLNLTEYKGPLLFRRYRISIDQT